MRYWYVIYTIHNQEFRAEANLKKQGFQLYLPKYIGTRKHARKVDKILKPLFPRYLFIKLDLSLDNISKINYTFGVNKLVTLGTEPNILPDFIVDNLRAQEDKNGNLDSIINSIYKMGEHVKFSNGVLQGNNAVFMGKTEKQRVFVLLNILGRKLNIAVPPVSLEPL